MDEDAKRPDPDAIVRRLQAEQDRQSRARLKIFLGFAPGVGKTYRMLLAARELVVQDVDLLVGVVETLAGYYISTAMKDFVSFFILILILIVKPTGLFPESVTKRV